VRLLTHLWHIRIDVTLANATISYMSVIGGAVLNGNGEKASLWY